VAEDFDLHNPTRILAFGVGLCLVLTRFGMLHQMETFLLGVNLRLLYLFGIPALLGVLLSGGIQRSFRGRPAYYFTGYLLWMGLAVPFSTWRGDSLQQFISYARTDFIMLLVIAGLTITWRECRLMMYAIAWGGVFSLGMARMFQSQSAGFQGRLGLQFGTVANPNDYAGHLLLVLPFVLWIVLSSKTLAIRLGALLIIAVGVWKILQTGSRGAAVGLAAAILVFLWRGTTRQRIAVLAMVPLMVAGLLVALPGSLVQRLQSFSSGDEGAVESSESRKYLFLKSVEYTLTHPIFGVGPGQFAGYEGQHNIVVGTHGYWH
jgi:O-antigen ligase